MLVHNVVPFAMVTHNVVPTETVYPIPLYYGSAMGRSLPIRAGPNQGTTAGANKVAAS